jgi:3-(3-hydroxy-phenyl)propionate hydroxylase
MSATGTRRAMFHFAYRRHPDQGGGEPAHHPVVIVGAGPVGLTLAIDLTLRGQKVVLLDDADRIGEGSRAICFSKRTLEVWDRLGVAEPMLEKGVVWQVGKVFLGEEQVYRFDLLPEPGHRMPAFINLQQYHAEAFLVARAAELGVDLRWRNRVVALSDGSRLTIDTPDGPYRLAADYVVACDGARSTLRDLVGAAFDGEEFEDRFLIADVKMRADFPTERWFWFDPPFHDGRSALLHRQPDDVWRIDLQLGPDADPDAERDPARVRPRIRRMLGHDDFSFEWISLYRFQCRRMRRFVHGNVIFAGDAAHQVSPFGARGANSGIEDAENLAWKLDLLLRSGSAALLESYDTERTQAADDNILNSTRATDFIAPRNGYETRLRTLTLRLARTHAFAKRMVNAGRLSTPSVYDSPLSTPDRESWSAGPPPGAQMRDVPLARGYLTEAFAAAGRGFTLLRHGAGATLPGLAAIEAAGEAFGARYDTRPGDAYLLRPDGVVAGRFRRPAAADLAAALARARGD